MTAENLTGEEYKCKRLIRIWNRDWALCTIYYNMQLIFANLSSAQLFDDKWLKCLNAECRHFQLNPPTFCTALAVQLWRLNLHAPIYGRTTELSYLSKAITISLLLILLLLKWINVLARSKGARKKQANVRRAPFLPMNNDDFLGRKGERGKRRKSADADIASLVIRCFGARHAESSG